MIQSAAIPENTTGKQTDLFANRSFHSAEESMLFFNRACQRLLNPNQWALLAGKEKASFGLFDRNGDQQERFAQVGDYVRIDLPGPGSPLGSGYDWVQIANIDRQTRNEGMETFLALQMRPSPAPGKSASPAHFFEAVASSTLAVHRVNNKVTTSHHGRNEVVNNHTGHVADNIRNTLVATGARWGLSELQWTAFIEGLLAD